MFPSASASTTLDHPPLFNDVRRKPNEAAKISNKLTVAFNDVVFLSLRVKMTKTFFLPCLLNAGALKMNEMQYIPGGSKMSRETKCNFSTTNRGFLPKYQKLQQKKFSSVLKNFTEIFSLLQELQLL